MYVYESLTPEEIGVKPHRDMNSGVASAIRFTVPVYRETKGCNYIEFYAFDPNKGRLRRKRIKTNRIKGVIKCRRYVRDLIRRVTDQLNRGWNPWIANDTSDLQIFSEILERFFIHIEKMLESGYYRKETYNGYVGTAKLIINLREPKNLQIIIIASDNEKLMKLNRNRCGQEYFGAEANNRLITGNLL